MQLKKNRLNLNHTLNKAGKFKVNFNKRRILLSMFKRIIKFSKNNSLFLFGARGTGKTFLLKEKFNKENSYFIDLLDPESYLRYSSNPSIIKNEIAALHKKIKWVIIDEVQKIPELLDVAQMIISEKKINFALTGSSARKLKRGGANLLAGRAFVNNLYPLTHNEIGDSFDITEILKWGSLPGIFSFTEDEDKTDFLRSYAYTYIKEEITQEQVVRKLDPFRRFLVVSAQMSGKIINCSKIARDIGSTTPTVQSYFQILEDTLLGFTIDSYHTSIRKSQRESPKFYYFDTGVLRALNNTLSLNVLPHTYQFGDLFEHFVINEINRLQHYHKKDFKMFFMKTKHGLEIDLVIERPGLKTALIEIKSSDNIREEDIKPLIKLSKDIPGSEAFCFSLDKTSKIFNNVNSLYWKKGLEEIGL